MLHLYLFQYFTSKYFCITNQGEVSVSPCDLWGGRRICRTRWPELGYLIINSSYVQYALQCVASAVFGPDVVSEQWTTMVTPTSLSVQSPLYVFVLFSTKITVNNWRTFICHYKGVFLFFSVCLFRLGSNL